MAGKKRPAPLPQEHGRNNKRRSISTTSRDTTAANSPTEQPAPRYAPIDTSYQPQADPAVMVTPTEAQLSSDHAQLAQIRHFNNGGSHNLEQLQHPFMNHVGSQEHQGIDPGLHQNGQYASQATGYAAQNAPQHRTLGRTLSMSMNEAGGTGTDEEKKSKKTANNNAANEKELRELIETNAHRSLESIARDVKTAERTHKAEKAKQLFAMRWLKQCCRRDNESVPRARVYAYYAQRCGSDRVDTLNPASFGKLVRIIFPGIQTRRLGVRGESKYHYVSLALVEDPMASNANGNGRPTSRMSMGSERGTPMDPDASFRHSARIPADSTIFPQPEPASLQQSPIDMATNPASQGHLFAEPAYPGFASTNSSRPIYKQNLSFSHLNDQPSSEQILRDEVPSLLNILPPGFDQDQARGLFELYVAHCTSLVDAVRYVKEKQFFKLFGTFNGTMTVPVVKLFQHPATAMWLQDCDRIMYQQMIGIVSPLVLQVLPQQVFLMLRRIGHELTGHIRRNFSHYPEHVLHAKIEMATVFSSLLQRLLRVNETAHAAANLLMKDEMRAMMWADWVSSVQPKRVIESSLTHCGLQETYNILTADMRLLLSPLPPPGAIEEPQEYIAAANNMNTEGIDWHEYATADTIMERWSAFLKKIPNRFPDVPTRNLLHCVESVGNAALRDITVNVAQSFGAWWTTKVWMDEMMLWLAEKGGFLDSEPQTKSPVAQQLDGGFDNIIDHSLNDANYSMSRPATASELPRPSSAHPNLDFQALPRWSPTANGQRGSSGPPTTTFKFTVTPRPADKHSHVNVDDFDDSGIGMSLLADGIPNFGISPFKSPWKSPLKMSTGSGESSGVHQMPAGG